MAELNKNATVEAPGDYCPVCNSRKVSENTNPDSGDTKVTYKCGAVYGHDGHGDGGRREGTGLWWLAKVCPHGVDPSLNKPQTKEQDEEPQDQTPLEEGVERVGNAIEALNRAAKGAPKNENLRAAVDSLKQARGFLKDYAKDLKKQAKEEAKNDASPDDGGAGGEQE